MAYNVNYLFEDLLYRLRTAPEQDSRNGRVKSLQQPYLFTIEKPRERVLFNPDRKANPYFHVMETVWMFGGCNDVNFLLPFNSNMATYAEDNGDIHGAYGHRWRKHFKRDQIIDVVNELTNNRDSRQAVITMYDPLNDYQAEWRDRPCNTHIYFRVRGHYLDMTVCNRSNDLVWGACGANMVHMTYLQELIASGLKLEVGHYHVMTNNLHIYEHHWHLMRRPLPYDWYLERVDIKPYPLLGPNETDIWEFMEECRMFVQYDTRTGYKSSWINDVVIPMYEHYTCRLNGDKDTYDINETKATDWRLAEKLWREWNDN